LCSRTRCFAVPGTPSADVRCGPADLSSPLPRTKRRQPSGRPGQRGLNHATTRRLKRFTRPSEAYPTKPVLRRCAGRPTLRATAAGHPGDFGATLAGRKWQRRRRTVTARLIAPPRSWQEHLDRAARVPQRARAAQRPGARVWRNDPQSGTGREATARLAKPMRMRMRSPRSSGRGSSACGAAELRRHAAQG